MYYQLQDTLNFLSNVPDPSGKSALDFVVNIWCTRQQEFYGTYDCKVRILSMCKLLEHTINNGDRRLSDIIVKGERRVDHETSSGIRTRSKAAKQPEQWTQIQAPLKFYKLIVDEFSNLCQNHDDVEEGSDEDDEDWENEEDMSASGAMKNFLGSVFAPAGDFPGFDSLFDFPVDEVEEDPDILEDPIYSMDIQNYLLEFLRAFSGHPSFPSYNGELNSHEKQTLKTAGIIQ